MEGVETRVLIVTPEQFRKGWDEFRPNEIPNVIHHDYRVLELMQGGNVKVAPPEDCLDA